MLNNEVFADGGRPTSSRSVYCMTKRNKRPKGYVVKWFASASLLPCNHSCMKKEWCTSTNFKLSAKNGGKGTCELSKHDISLIKENTVFHEQQGVTFSMHFKVNIIIIPSREPSCDVTFIYFNRWILWRSTTQIRKLKTGEELRSIDWNGHSDWSFSLIKIKCGDCNLIYFNHR